MQLVEHFDLVERMEHLYGGHKFDLYTDPVGNHLKWLLEKLDDNGIKIQPTDCQPNLEEIANMEFRVYFTGKTIFQFQLRGDNVEITITDYHERIGSRRLGGDVSIYDGIKCTISYQGPKEEAKIVIGKVKKALKEFYDEKLVLPRYGNIKSVRDT